MESNRIYRVFGSIQKIHMIGIGGIGMSGIADVLLRLNFKVSGSDSVKSSITDHLKDLGAEIYIGHNADNIQNSDVVVYSSAIKPDNPEYARAKRLNIKLIRRAEFLGMLLSVWSIRIGVAGTHGKTTTSSMLSSVLDASGSQPSLFIGGIIKGLNTNARLGSEDYVIFEADEYDRTFLALPPTHAIITNVEADHLDIYSDLQDMKNTFIRYANSVPEDGKVIICYDDENARSLIPYIDRLYVTYGTDPRSDFYIHDIEIKENTEFSISYKGQSIGHFQITQLGLHMILNAAAALVTAYLLFQDMSAAAKGISTFAGVERRFELRHEHGEIKFYDDYAHHPTEIRATLEAVKAHFPDQRLIAVFQPHLFSRTRDFLDDFAKSLTLADIVFVTSIYPAREKPIKGVHAESIVDIMKKTGFNNVTFVKDKNDLPLFINPLIHKNDIIMSIGAGDIWMTLDKIYKEFIA